MLPNALTVPANFDDKIENSKVTSRSAGSKYGGVVFDFAMLQAYLGNGAR